MNKKLAVALAALLAPAAALGEVGTDGAAQGSTGTGQSTQATGETGPQQNERLRNAPAELPSRRQTKDDYNRPRKKVREHWWQFWRQSGKPYSERTRDNGAPVDRGPWSY